MKHLKLFKALSPIVKPYIKQMEYVCTINANEKHVAYPIAKRQRGIYAFYPKGKKRTPIYLGETIACLLTRISCHKHSLRDPSWTVEVTGKKFNYYGVDCEQDLDVYFIPYDDEISKYDSRTIEGMFKIVMKPIVFA